MLVDFFPRTSDDHHAGSLAADRGGRGRLDGFRDGARGDEGLGGALEGRGAERGLRVRNKSMDQRNQESRTRL